MRYLILTYYRKPSGQIDEVMSLARNLKKTDLQTGNVILDFKTLKVVKATMGGTNVPNDFNRIVEYYMQHYESTITRLFKENGWDIEFKRNQESTTDESNPQKQILVDADGVLLGWEYAFSIWMEEHGFTKVENGAFLYDIGERYNIDSQQSRKLIRMFNESAAIGFLPPHRDAMYYVKRLHEEHGYVFHCITSLSKDINAQRLREMNLKKLFGETAFEKIVCLDTGADKNNALEPYRDSGCWWVEDKPENADVGASMGLRSVLMEHGHNMNHACPYPVVKNWREIYELITS